MCILTRFILIIRGMHFYCHTCLYPGFCFVHLVAVWTASLYRVFLKLSFVWGLLLYKAHFIFIFVWTQKYQSYWKSSVMVDICGFHFPLSFGVHMRNMWIFVNVDICGFHFFPPHEKYVDLCHGRYLWISLFPPHEKYADLCHQLFHSAGQPDRLTNGCLAGQKCSLVYYGRTFEPNSFIPAMHLGSVDLCHCSSLSSIFNLAGVTWSAESMLGS